MSDSFLGKIKKVLEAPKPPPHILARQQHQVVIPWYSRLWDAIRPPRAIGSEREPISRAQRRMLIIAPAAIVLGFVGYASYSYIASAEERSVNAFNLGMTHMRPGDYPTAIARPSRPCDT